MFRHQHRTRHPDIPSKREPKIKNKNKTKPKHTKKTHLESSQHSAGRKVPMAFHPSAAELNTY